MSTLHVENIKGPTSGSNANKVTLATGQTLYAPGHVIQAASFSHFTYINAGTGTSYSEQMSSFRPYITPTTTSSKIVMIFNLAWNGDIDNDSHSSMSAQFKIETYTGGTNGSSGTFDSNAFESGSSLLDRGGQTRMRPTAYTGIFSPNTTDEVHYRIQTRVVSSASGRVLMFNQSMPTTMTLLEIGA